MSDSRQCSPARYFERTTTCDELCSTSPIDSLDWLSEPEQAELARLRDANRRREWLCGRRLSKELVRQACRELDAESIDDLASISILSRNESGQAVRPVVRMGEAVHRWCLSISHSEGVLLVALSTDEDVSIGVDLTPTEEFDSSFVKTWFSDRERSRVDASEHPDWTTLWAIKEAVYKACNQGESFTPRRVEVLMNGKDDFEIDYDGMSLVKRCRVETRTIEGQAAAVVKVTPADSPNTRKETFQADRFAVVTDGRAVGLGANNT